MLVCWVLFCFAVVVVVVVMVVVVVCVCLCECEIFFLVVILQKVFISFPEKKKVKKMSWINFIGLHN